MPSWVSVAVSSPVEATQADDGLWANSAGDLAIVGSAAFNTRYQSWSAAGGLARTVGAFVDGSANFLVAIGLPLGVAVALMGVLVASFAGTTLDTACRLQRYVVQELAATFASRVSPTACAACGYDLSFNVSGACPECGKAIDHDTAQRIERAGPSPAPASPKLGTSRLAPMSIFNPIFWLTNKHGATIFAVTIALIIAALPAQTPPYGFWEAITTGLPVGGHGQILQGHVAGSMTMVNGLSGARLWLTTYSGTGGLILWPMFGATNQLLAGLAFLVIAFWLWRRRVPVWFLIFPMIFMLIMPAWAMLAQLFQGMGNEPAWLFAPTKNWVLIFIAVATLILEAWMIVEAVLLWPKVRGILEPQLEGVPAQA